MQDLPSKHQSVVSNQQPTTNLFRINQVTSCGLQSLEMSGVQTIHATCGPNSQLLYSPSRANRHPNCSSSSTILKRSRANHHLPLVCWFSPSVPATLAPPGLVAPLEDPI